MGSGDVLQPVAAELPKADSLGLPDDVPRRARHHDLTPVRDRADAGCDVHVQADVPRVTELGLAGMDPDPHARLGRRCPRLGGERALQVRRCFDGVARTLEDDEAAVPGPIDLVAPLRGLADELANPSEQLRVALAEAEQKARRALEIGEEQRDGPAREPLSRGAGRGRPCCGGRPLDIRDGDGERQVERRVVTQDRRSSSLQRLARVEAELVDERGAGLLVGGEARRPAGRPGRAPASGARAASPAAGARARAPRAPRSPRRGGRARDRPGAGARARQGAAPPAGRSRSGRKARTRSPQAAGRARARAPRAARRPPPRVRRPRAAAGPGRSKLSKRSRSRAPGLEPEAGTPWAGSRRRPRPSSLRSCETYTWTALVGGRGRMLAPELVDDPRRRDDLVRPARAARRAALAASRWPSGSSRPSFQTASGPRMPNSTQRTYHLQQTIDSDPDTAMFASRAPSRRFLGDNPRRRPEPGRTARRRARAARRGAC